MSFVYQDRIKVNICRSETQILKNQLENFRVTELSVVTTFPSFSNVD
jgi:hypothetical protein